MDRALPRRVEVAAAGTSSRGHRRRGVTSSGGRGEEARRRTEAREEGRRRRGPWGMAWRRTVSQTKGSRRAAAGARGGEVARRGEVVAVRRTRMSWSCRGRREEGIERATTWMAEILGARPRSRGRVMSSSGTRGADLGVEVGEDGRRRREGPGSHGRRRRRGEDQVAGNTGRGWELTGDGSRSGSISEKKGSGGLMAKRKREEGLCAKVPRRRRRQGAEGRGRSVTWWS